MTHVALRGRGHLAPIAVFQPQVCSSKVKVLCLCQRCSTETTCLQHGSFVFGDTNANGGSNEKYGYIARNRKEIRKDTHENEETDMRSWKVGEGSQSDTAQRAWPIYDI